MSDYEVDREDAFSAVVSEITRLLAEIEHKDEALREIAEMVDYGKKGTTSSLVIRGTIYEAVDVAIKALQNKEAGDGSV